MIKNRLYFVKPFVWRVKQFGVLRMSRHVAVSLPSLAWLYSASPTINVAMSAIGWTAAALALALASVIFSFRLTGRRV